MRLTCPNVPHEMHWQDGFLELPNGSQIWMNQEFGMFRNPDTRQPIPDPENYKRMFINPLDNVRNLSQEYLDSLQNAPEAYRRRFFLGQYTAEGCRPGL